MIPHDQRRYECIHAKLAELEVVREEQVPLRFARCDGYARHGCIPQDFGPFDGFWRCGADEHAWISFTPSYLPCGEGQSLFLELDTGASGWDASNPQMLLFYDGRAVRGIDTNHRRVPFPAGVARVDAYLYSGTDPVKVLPVQAKFLVRDERIHALEVKFSVLCDILSYLGEETKVRSDVSEALREAVNALDFRMPYSAEFYASVGRAERLLVSAAEEPGKKGAVWAVGHTHIDFAWLWTKQQTAEKALRSFGTALRLLQEHPSYRFMSSQPALYECVRRQDGDMYEKIRECVRKGIWEPEGAMWVEADCNLTSGESLVRQILVGKQFFREEFGVESKVLWLPDVFGYSAALPQILKKCGIEAFVTSKISWNEYNRMPHEIFSWQGIDGTEVLTYFMTTQAKVKDAPSYEFVTYNGEGTAREVEGTYFRLTDKALSEDVLMPTGHGDGGGGTTPAMIERIDYLSRGIKGCRRAAFSTVGEFFARLKNNLKGKELPRWVGELYLEFHRGTYTSVAKIKRNNRRAEFALWRAEWESSLAELLCGISYPRAEIAEHLKTVLTNQFHDILPGSSIGAVYDATDEDYRHVFSGLGAIERNAMSVVAAAIGKEGIAVFNPNSFEGEGTVVADGVTCGVTAVPSKGYAVFGSLQTENKICVSESGMENAFFRISFDGEGFIDSLYDIRAGRETVRSGGRCNRIVPYENLPYEFDNWELKDYYREKPLKGMRLVSVRPVCDGVRRGLEFRRSFLHSELLQTVWLYENLPRIDFETRLDWHEHHMVLRAEFDTDIHAGNATYDVQFGSVSRPSNDNTSWEAARFETCAHKWVDVSEYGYGVSLLNDCKYGHSVRGGTIGLTLLTCGTYPDPNADQGEHIFTYSLMPHEGDWRTAGVVGQAYLLNNPLIAVRTNGTGPLPEAFSFVRCDDPAIVLETVKTAEEGGGYIVRAYESFGGRTECRIRTGFPLAEVAETDLTERGRQPVGCDGNSFACTFRPFEIKTFFLRGK